jgi:ATP synthase protein I
VDDTSRDVPPGTPADPAPAPGPNDASRTRQAAAARFEALAAAGAIGSVGLSFVLAVVIGTAFGWWLDKVTGWSPVCLLVFFVLGLAAGFRNVYVTTKRYMK